MDTSRIIPPPARIASPIPPLASRARPARRDMPTLLAAQLVAAGVDRFVSDHDVTLVIDVIYLGHLNRQAMLGAQALLRGDDSAEQVW